MSEVIKHPTVSEAWSEIVQRKDISQYVDIETVLDAAEEADSLLEASRGARLQRASCLSVLTWLGIAKPQHGTATLFPPDDVEERIAKLRRGVLPEDARAREWEPDRDDGRGQVSVLGMVLAYWVLALFLLGGLALGVVL